jgi:hypothetical protein
LFVLRIARHCRGRIHLRGYHPALLRRVLMRKRILIPLLLTSIPGAVLAQIFGPTIVFDPTVSGRVLTEIAQIVKLYNTATQTYNQIAYNARWFTNKSRWLGIATQVVNSNTRSVFGETGGWNSAVTAGINIPGVWNNATYGIHPPPFYASFPVGASSTSANIASVNVAEPPLRGCYSDLH